MVHSFKKVNFNEWIFFVKILSLRGTYVKPLCVGKGPFTLWFDGKYINTSSTKILDLSCFWFRRKKIFSSFFNITSVGEKLISNCPSLISFRILAQKSTKMREWFWESLRVGPDLEHGQSTIEVSMQKHY